MTKNKDWINDFFKIGNGQVRFMATRNEVIDFISKVESQAREQGRREMAESIIELLNKENQTLLDNFPAHSLTIMENETKFNCIIRLIQKIQSKYLTNKDE